MKRLIVKVAAVLVTGTVFLISGQGPAEAGRAYDIRDLEGTYYYVTTQIRLEQLPGEPEKMPVFCSSYGIATFDGLGGATTNETGRCGVAGPYTMILHHTYSVDPNGSVLMTGIEDPLSSTHCQIVDKGRSLLCDGTMQGIDSYSFMAIGVKQ